MPYKDKKKAKQYIKDYHNANKEQGKLARKKYYNKNIDKIKERRRKYKIENKEKISIQNKEYRKRVYSTSKYHFGIYKYKAKKRGLDFKIDFKEFQKLWQKKCGYCGSNIETVGIDRIDNNKGYIKGNIKSCCWMCNNMKNTYTEKEFMKQCKKICDFNNL